MLMDMPYKIANAIVFNITLYFMANLRREPGPFFFFLFRELPHHLGDEYAVPHHCVGLPHSVSSHGAGRTSHSGDSYVHWVRHSGQLHAWMVSLD